MPDYNTYLDLVARLVKQYRINRAAYHAPDYKEAHARQDLIDPLFVALGWDVHNEQHVAPQYREVIPEDSLDVEGQRKAPDYAFRVGQTTKFFAEAKKPGVAIKTASGPAYQLRRYAWSAKLPLSLLTDFEELAVYDCRSRPSEKDKAAAGRINFYTFEQYPDQWREIWDVFSREAVWAGSFDQFTQAGKGRGTSEVDAEFLREIEGWREALARNMALRNPRLGIDDLNDAVQRTIDRIIFLRMAEDRGIEPYEQLLKLTLAPGPSPYEGEGRLYADLIDLCRRADAKYNAGLFDLSPGGDRITPRLSLDDKALQSIIKDLYFPQSPYEFSVLPAEILGNVYEQFLGKVIRLTPSHRAQVEEKPEVKKAGGVYYTPAYIVDYIVKNTVGRQIEGKSPRQLEGFRVLDMACGSGSFLLGAYQCLLDYYVRWYTGHDPDRHPKAVRRRGEECKLTIAEKKRILTAHIFGVDIDRQAVEVTKLSLLLRVLEGESTETLQMALPGFQERALPNLDQNVKCGNSLIGPDYFTGQLLPDPDELRRVNPFDWEREFSLTPSPSLTGRRAGDEGGFDCVIGNPPYGASFGETEAAYFHEEYHVFRGIRDVYTCFIEAGLMRLKKGGKFSFIVPSAWLGGPDYENLRELLLSRQIDVIVLLPFDVFADAYVDTTIFVVSNSGAPVEHQVRTYVYGKREKLTSITLVEQDYKTVSQEIWRRTESKKFVLEPAAVQLLDQIRRRCPSTFGDVVEIKRGVLFDKDLLTHRRTSANSHKYFEGDVYRYQLNLIASRWIEFGDQMKERPKEFAWFEGSRLLLRRLVNRRQRLMATFTSETFVTNKNLYSILAKDGAPNILAILGVLNSRLISYLYINQVTQATKDDFPQVTIKDMLALPFPEMTRVARHDRLVALVEQMLGLHKRLAAASERDRELYQRQIDATDREIDRLVYDLYGLTEEEIGIVERG